MKPCTWNMYYREYNFSTRSIHSAIAQVFTHTHANVCWQTLQSQSNIACFFSRYHAYEWNHQLFWNFISWWVYSCSLEQRNCSKETPLLKRVEWHGYGVGRTKLSRFGISWYSKGVPFFPPMSVGDGLPAEEIIRCHASLWILRSQYVFTHWKQLILSHPDYFSYYQKYTIMAL